MYKLSIKSRSKDESRVILDYLYKQGYKWMNIGKYSHLNSYSFEVDEYGFISASLSSSRINEDAKTLEEYAPCYNTPLWEAMNG